MSRVKSLQSRLTKYGVRSPYDICGVNRLLLVSYLDFLEDNPELKWVARSRARSVCDFLSTTDQDLRQTYAERLIKEHWELWNKDLYSVFLDKLMTSQLGMKLFDRFQRDHVSHLAYVFLLGLYLYNTDKDIQDAIRNHESLAHLPLRRRSGWTEELDFFFMWNVISTFHDLGYPFESFSKEMCSYMSMLNNMQGRADRKTNSFSLSFKELEILSDNRSSFEIINQAQMKHDKENNYLDLQRYFEHELKSGIIDHGVLSALFLLKTTDIIYTKREWFRGLFRQLFPEIALAIAIHNIDWNVIKGTMGISETDLPNITLQDFPFCYLLILADSLQEWDRPSLARPTLPSTGMSIAYNKNERKFSVRLALGKADANKIEYSLKSKISTTDGKSLPSVTPVIKNY